MEKFAPLHPTNSCAEICFGDLVTGFVMEKDIGPLFASMEAGERSDKTPGASREIDADDDDNLSRRDSQSNDTRGASSTTTPRTEPRIIKSSLLNALRPVCYPPKLASYCMVPLACSSPVAFVTSSPMVFSNAGDNVYAQAFGTDDNEHDDMYNSSGCGGGRYLGV
eukprot:CAMPEP_0172491266 /NCGR_PEP_ID=MMETSP1066-20121228/22004_1 /TAXON_ID=671091 /ORGANISM="Coscinodiscus wailesii, Strain CCMP2513" /LENGTH=165 /DNA_ID=CAMNT_0013260213 /DNA_START=209 /DNA_END=707 /DNA_ORIENTATION=-